MAGGLPRDRKRAPLDPSESATLRAVTDDLQHPELVAVGPKDREVLEALLDSYLGELSSHREHPVGATKATEYRDLDSDFGQPGRHAFLLFARGNVAGFALIRGPESTGSAWQVAEFYVQPGARRCGLGRWAMRSIWKRFPGV